VSALQHPIAEAKFVPTFAGNAQFPKCGQTTHFFSFSFFIGIPAPQLTMMVSLAAY
jgi:hypothetical protein